MWMQHHLQLAQAAHAAQAGGCGAGDYNVNPWLSVGRMAGWRPSGQSHPIHAAASVAQAKAVRAAAALGAGARCLEK